MKIESYLKSIHLLSKAEASHPWPAILIQMDLSAHIADLPYITQVVDNAINKAKQESKA